MQNRRQEERRLLLLAGSAREERHASRLLKEDGIEVCCCQSIDELVSSISEGAAALLLSEGVILQHPAKPLLRVLQGQPAWSDLSVVMVTSDDRPGWLTKTGIVNVTILRQPVHVESLLSVVRAALASRERQYEIRDLLVKQEETQRELLAIDRRKDEFLATLAHELRNPLSPIMNSLDLVRMDHGTLGDEPELVEIMHRQVRQLTRLVDDLLDVSRITRGKVRLVRQVIDLRDAIRAGVEASTPFITQSEQTLAVDSGTAPIYVDGDSSRLAQCVANVLNNAAKYTPRGGNIWVSAKAAKGMAELTIRDNGIGIAPEQIDSVFDLFRQHDVDSERGQAGLGIGLTLVQNLVQLHAGTIEVISEGLGLGSQFTIRLPTAVLTDESDRDESRDDHAVTKAAYKVLVVEDLRANRFVLKRLLELMGHDVTTAEDGLDGLEKAIGCLPDVIISDISMPRMNGLQLAREIRSNRDFDGTMLIAMTGYGSAEDKSTALAAGFNRHLTKPVDATLLQDLFGGIADG